MLMSLIRLTLLTLGLAGSVTVAQETAKPARMMSAYEAVGLLSPEEQAALARIEARDGSPVPERWHLLIYDPAGEAGLRQFTVVDGKIVGSHSVSQFAQSLAPADVFTANSLLFDSVHVARIAQEYCRTNGVTVTSLNYDLRKGTTDGAPLWTVQCVNAKGEELGKIVVSAGRGTVIFHPGFAAEPLPEVLLDRPRPPPLTTSNVAPNAPIESARNRPVSTGAPAPAAPPRRRPGQTTPAGPTPKPNIFQRVFGPGR